MASLTFIDPDGQEFALADKVRAKTLKGLAGLLMPPFQVDHFDRPGGEDAAVSEVHARPRDVDVPVMLQAGGDVTGAIAELARAVNPLRGDGTLRFVRGDGVARVLTPVRYIAGLEGVYTDETYGPTWAKNVLVFRAFAPLWQDEGAIEASYAVSVTATFFPFFPLRVSGSEVFTEQPIINDGHADAWPVWTITGPGSSLALRNLTTGESLSIAATIAAGETVTIDTRPGFKTVRRADGTNLYPAMGAGSTLWRLVQGTNRLRVEFANVTPASLVSLSFRRRWLVP